MSIGASKGGSRSSSKSKTDLDPQLKAALYGNIADTQNFAKTPYQALTGDQINQYKNPYDSAVRDATMADLERARQTAQIDNDVSAQKAGAFGGSRHGILGAQTNSEYDRNTAGILGALNQQGYSQALQTAQTENTQANDYNLQLRQLINQALGLVPSYGTTKGSQSGTQFGLTANYTFGPPGG